MPESKAGMMYTTKTGAKVLGIKQDTLKHYAVRFGIGSQPGGSGTPYVFSHTDLEKMLDARVWRWPTTEAKEDRDVLGLGPMFDLNDFKPKPVT